MKRAKVMGRPRWIRGGCDPRATENGQPRNMTTDVEEYRGAKAQATSGSSEDVVVLDALARALATPERGLRDVARHAPSLVGSVIEGCAQCAPPDCMPFQ